MALFGNRLAAGARRPQHNSIGLPIAPIAALLREWT